MTIIATLVSSSLLGVVTPPAHGTLDAYDLGGAPGGMLANMTAAVAQSDSLFAGVGVIALIMLIVCVLILGAFGGTRRRKQLSSVAESLGLKFVPDKDKTRMGHRFDHIHQFGSHKGSTSDHLVGRIGDWGVVACNHSYYWRYGRNSRFRDQGTILVQIPLTMPEVIIEPRSWGDKIVSILGVKYVDFESRKFSRRFAVRAKDPNFAQNLIHPDAMKWLLRHRHYRWEFDRHTVAMYQVKRFKPRQIPKAIQAATEFIKLIPEHMWARSQEEEGIGSDHTDRKNQPVVACAPVEPQPDLTFRRVKRARVFAPLSLLFGLNQVWMALTDFVHSPGMSNLQPNMIRAAFGAAILWVFCRMFRRLRAFREQRRGLVPSSAEIFCSGATAIRGTCPKCSSVWEFSSLDRGKATDCPSCTAKFDVPDKGTLDVALESCTVA